MTDPEFDAQYGPHTFEVSPDGPGCDYCGQDRGHKVHALTCLDQDETCAGTVEYRMSLSGTGASFPRCDKHWSDRLDVQEGIDRRYPVTAPDDFDPYYAGESWDEEDY